MRPLTDFIPNTNFSGLLFFLDEDDDGQDNLEPIDASNIIQGGRRTRGKAIDYADAAQGLDDMDDEDDDDEEYESRDDNNDDDQMRD
jgi:hypothetical protein